MNVRGLINRGLLSVISRAGKQFVKFPPPTSPKWKLIAKLRRTIRLGPVRKMEKRGKPYKGKPKRLYPMGREPMSPSRERRYQEIVRGQDRKRKKAVDILRDQLDEGIRQTYRRRMGIKKQYKSRPPSGKEAFEYSRMNLKRRKLARIQRAREDRAIIRHLQGRMMDPQNIHKQDRDRKFFISPGPGIKRIRVRRGRVLGSTKAPFGIMISMRSAREMGKLEKIRASHRQQLRMHLEGKRPTRSSALLLGSTKAKIAHQAQNLSRVYKIPIAEARRKAKQHINWERKKDYKHGLAGEYKRDKPKGMGKLEKAMTPRMKRLMNQRRKLNKPEKRQVGRYPKGILTNKMRYIKGWKEISLGGYQKKRQPGSP